MKKGARWALVFSVWMVVAGLVACAAARLELAGSPCVSGTYSSVQYIEEAGDLYGLELNVECTNGRLTGLLKEYEGSPDGEWPVHGAYDPSTQGVILFGATQYGTIELSLHRAGIVLEGTATRHYKGGTSEERVRLTRK